MDTLSVIVKRNLLTFPVFAVIKSSKPQLECHMIISIINNKGGVGKTATTINLAHALANKGKKVLVIDQDSQCNSTSSLLPTSVNRSLKEIYGGDTDISTCIYSSKFDGVDVLPNEQLTSSMEMTLYQDISNSARLFSRVVRPYALDHYDFVIIDTPPTLGLWLIMALAASDCAIVPVDAGSAYAIDGLTTSIKMINDVAAQANPNLSFLRVLINKADLRTSISRTLGDFSHRSFGADKVFSTTIPYNTSIQQAELARTSVIRHAPASMGTKRFRELADEVIKITSEREPTLFGANT
jgi:chromosome partitioning protein